MSVELVTPTVDEVAAQMRFRLKDKFNNVQPTFNAQTYPTDTDVAALIPKAVADIELDTGSDVTIDNLPESLRDAAKDLAIIKAAMRVELSFFSEQVAQGLSPYQAFKEEYRDGIKRLDTAIANEAVGNEPGPQDSGGDAPLGYFGDGVDCMTGRYGYWIKDPVTDDLVWVPNYNGPRDPRFG